MQVVWAALLVVVSACGRIGFDGSQPTIGGPGVDSASADGAACFAGGCAAGQYCETPVGMCSAAGTCAAIPTAPGLCAGTDVCGCDGKSYLNACEAARAGQGIEVIGPCTV